MDTPIKTMRIVSPDGGYLTINADDFDPAVHKVYVEKGQKGKAKGDEHAAATTVAGAKAGGERVNPPTPDPDRADEQPEKAPVIDTGFNVGAKVVDEEGHGRLPENLAEAEALKRAADPTAAKAKELLEKSAGKGDAPITELAVPDAQEWIGKQTDKAALRKALAAEQKHERYDGGRKSVVDAIHARLDSL